MQEMFPDLYLFRSSISEEEDNEEQFKANSKFIRTELQSRRFFFFSMAIAETGFLLKMTEFLHLLISSTVKYMQYYYYTFQSNSSYLKRSEKKVMFDPENNCEYDWLPQQILLSKILDFSLSKNSPYPSHLYTPYVSLAKPYLKAYCHMFSNTFPVLDAVQMDEKFFTYLS